MENFYMIKNLFSLKTDLTKIYLLREEVDLFNSIDKKIIINFKKILCKINDRDIDFQLYENNFDEKYLLSFTDNQNKNFYPLDYKNPWSNYNFFLKYFEFGEYKFDVNIFQKIHIKLNRFTFFSNINILLNFLPFYIRRPSKRCKTFLYKYFPSFLLKDSSFVNNRQFNRHYCYHFKKTKYIKQGIKKVINNLDDKFSKNNYSILINSNTEMNWRNYFNKAVNNYQYSSFVKLDKKSVIINCGVEAGSELKLFNNVNTIYNLDPTKDNKLDISVKYILDKSKTKIFFFEEVLYSISTLPKSKKNAKDLKATNLLDFIKNHNITKIDLIKSDVEGAERFMVNDLITICKKFNTQLAISIYHTNRSKAEDEQLIDLVDIPLKLIDELRNDYNFYFNHYSYQRNEGILYCVPKLLNK